jgi:hypothetical protein
VSDFNEWAYRKFEAPCPHVVKLCCLLRNNLPDATWVETGTLHGVTSEFLSHNAKFVYTIEPEISLFNNAKEKFKDKNNIQVINDISENALPNLLPTLSGNICFWLDGHNSGPNTFAGPNDTPLRQELDCISENLHRFNKVSILIDDIRFCGKIHIYGEYPTLDELVDFARSNNLDWYIEHDIFVAKSR